MDRSRTTVLITGTTNGVGRLVARRLAGSGARVLAHGRSDGKGRDTLRELQREASQSHVEFLRADLASLDEARRLANEVATTHDRLDILINNAVVPGQRPSAAPAFLPARSDRHIPA